MNPQQAQAAQNLEAGIQGMLIQFLIPIIVLVIYSIVVWWKIFTKAGQPGWAILVPFYNYVVMCRIAGKPDWYWLLWFIPCVGIIFAIIWTIEFAKSFGKDVVFAIFGIMIFGIIGLSILAFGAEYVGPGGSSKGRKGLRSQRFEDEDDEGEDDRPRRRSRDDDDDDQPGRRR